MGSTFLCGAHVHANGIRHHYLRYGEKLGKRTQSEGQVLTNDILGQ